MSEDQLLKFKPEATKNYIIDIRRAIESPQTIEKDSLDPVTAANVKDQEKDTELKELYATWFIGILIGQLSLLNIIFISVGFNLLTFQEPGYLKLYMGGTLSEVFGVVYVITRYLFSRKNPSN